MTPKNLVVGFSASMLLHGLVVAALVWLPEPPLRPPGGPVLVPLRVFEVINSQPPAPTTTGAESAATPSSPATPATRVAPPIMNQGPRRAPAVHRSPYRASAPIPDAVAAALTPQNATAGAGPIADDAIPNVGPSGQMQADTPDGQIGGATGSRAAGPIASTGPGPAASGRNSTLSDLRTAYAMDVRRALESVGRYPAAARRLGLAGRVVLRLRIDDDGRILRSVVDAPSPHSELDVAALASTQRLHALNPPPGGAIDVIVPVVFTMRTR